jgi:hypothetical protein
MGNSPLVNYAKISPHRTSPRNGAIRKITIHHMAGSLSVEQCGALFADPVRKGSANYGIGPDGRVGMYVEEKDRAWSSDSPDNDSQAVTIEIADSPPDWYVPDALLAKAIDLCADICKRNGIAALVYDGTPSGTLTRHNMFRATVCPGPYLQSKFAYIADEVNRRIGAPVTGHWADGAGEYLESIGVKLTDRRWDDPVTRGEVVAMLARYDQARHKP